MEVKILIKGVHRKYDKQVERIVSYFQAQQKSKDNLKIGGEFEHFVVNEQSLRAVTYEQPHGIRDLLAYLTRFGWEAICEGENIIGLKKGRTTITLEPGAQLELSTPHSSKIKDIEANYLSFAREVIPYLSEHKQLLMALGYQPVSKIADIPFIPKKRYDFMSSYLSKRGKYALNMMKGTASIQITIDYTSEADFVKKYQIVSYLAPLIALLTDNSPFFEGEIFYQNLLRTLIWLNCDRDRCGILPNAFNNNFGYETYARYILDHPPMLVKKDGEMTYTDDTPFKDIFEPESYTDAELEYALTMYFPDVRVKQFIEIRMADALPYPMNFALVAFIKGLLYDSDNLDIVYNKVCECNANKSVFSIREEVLTCGFDTYFCDQNIAEIIIDFVELARKGLSDEEKHYLKPIEKLSQKRENPAMLIKTKLKHGKTRKEASGDLIINQVIEYEK